MILPDELYRWLGRDAEAMAAEVNAMAQRDLELRLAEQERLRNLPEAMDE